MHRFSRCLRLAGVVPFDQRRAGSPRKLYDAITNPGVTAAQLASLANALAPQLTSSSELTIPEKYHILTTLSSRAVRHEDVLQKCIWDILKADLTGPQQGAWYTKQLAACTGSTFHIMASLGFKNDHQMTALALGRCVELIGLMPLPAVVKVYQGLAAMDLAFFSLASVALYAPDVTANFTTADPITTEPLDSQKDSGVTSSVLASQPNLIDIVCAELENRLVELSQDSTALTLEDGKSNFAQQDGRALDKRASLTVPQRMEESIPQDEQVRFFLLLGTLVRALSRVGAGSPTVFSSLQSLFRAGRPSSLNRRLSWEDRALVATSLMEALRDTCLVGERVIDPMNHADSPVFAAARDLTAAELAVHVSQLPGLANTLRHTPPLVLSARGLFETLPELAEWCPELWDQVRSVRVAHKHVVAAKAPGKAPSARLGGKLFGSQFAVKVKPVSQDLSEAERFIPPQFKTWRSPVHKPRGGHNPSSRGPGKAVKFGTRRISKNYLKNKRKKYAQGQ